MIILKSIKPDPIYSKPTIPNSMIWNKELIFEKGKKYWVRAPSGGGKSTLLHIIFGLRKDYQGELEIEGKNISELDSDEISEIRKNKISIVFQNLRLLGELTAWENLELARSLTGKIQEGNVRSMASSLGLEDLLNQKTETMSYGQQQRLAIVRALSKPFDFLLLDEPFSHLDNENIRRACKLINEKLMSNNAGLILVSHESTYDFEIDGEYIL